MKIFKDKNLTQESEILDFGILEAGDTKQFTFYVSNDSLAFLKELEFIVEHKELEIEEAPHELLAYASDKIVIKWEASVTLKEGLKAILHVKGKELWG